MTTLSRDALGRARRWVEEHGRPLERARLAHHFDGAPAGAVVEALRAFAAGDGGFGHGLEPDFQLPDASVWATVIAFRVLAEIGVGDDEPLASAGVRFLHAAFRPDDGWRDVPAAVNDHPHAPWWTWSPERGPGPQGRFGLPNADVLAILQRHAALLPEGFLAEAGALAAKRLAEEPAPIGEYVAQSWLTLLSEAPEPLALAIRARLAPDIHGAVKTKPDDWATSEYQPFWLAPGPDAPFGETLAPVVLANLDFQITRQAAEGCWEPNWSWYGSYDDAWPTARLAWCSELTAHTLLALDAWGRIEGRARAHG